MELEERDFGAPRIALDVDGGGIAVLLGDVVLVVGARNGGEGRDALRGGCVAGQTVGEAAAVGLSRGVDAGGVEAVSVFEVCEHLHGEGDVVDSVGVGVALPFVLYHLLAAPFFFNSLCTKCCNDVHLYPADKPQWHPDSNPHC